MQDLNEHNISGEFFPEPEVVEVEPNKEPADKMVPFVDFEAIARDEMDKLLNLPIAEA